MTTWRLSMDVWVNYFRSGGWLMVPLIVISFGIWYAYLKTAVRLRLSLRCHTLPEADFAGFLTTDQSAEELSACLLARPGAVPRVVRHVLARMRWGLDFREAFAQCRESEVAPYGSALIVLAALVSAAPLLGLLGTVLGMVETFSGVASRSGGSVDLVAGGISQALITTQIGLVAALPGTFGLAHVFQLYRKLGNAIDFCEAQMALVVEHPAPDGS